MLAENMNTTTSFVIVVLVATHGIIGNETTLDTIEEQTEDSLGLTTESISRNDDLEISSTYLEDNITTTEQVTTNNESTSAEIRAAKRNLYEETTEDSRATTEQNRIAPNNESTEYFKTSITHKTTTEHQTPTISVKEQILKQGLKENVTEINELTRISDKDITNTTEIDESLRAPFAKQGNTTEQLSDRSIEIVEDKKDKNTSQHELIMDMKELFKPDDGEIELTTNARRMLNFDPVLLESKTGRNNMETATVARTSSLPRPLSSTKDHFSSHQENLPKAYGNRQHYSNPLTPFNSLETSTIPLLPHFTNQQPNFYQPPRTQYSNSMEHGLASRMAPYSQFDNHQHVTVPLPVQTSSPPFQFWPSLLPMETLHPLSSSQPHQQFSSQMPDRRMSTIQPSRTNRDNIFTTLQRASLHPVLSTKQYTDFYHKMWNMNMFNN